MTLTELLDSAGLRYTERTTSRGAPYAGFGWSSRNPEAPLGLTALIDERARYGPVPVLRLTAHGITNDGGGPLGRLRFTTLRLARGRLARPQGAEASDLITTVWLGQDPAGALLEALTGLESIRDWLAGTGEMPAPPAPVAAITTMTADNVLVELGESASGETVGWASCAGVRPEHLPLAELDALQRWAPDGRYVLDPDGFLRAEVAGGPPSENTEGQVAATVAALVAKVAVAAAR
jgi:hypothetical protein